MKVVVAAFNQEKALVGAFSVITNLRMKLFEALVPSVSPVLAQSSRNFRLLSNDWNAATSNVQVFRFSAKHQIMIQVESRETVPRFRWWEICYWGMNTKKGNNRPAQKNFGGPCPTWPWLSSATATALALLKDLCLQVVSTEKGRDNLWTIHNDSKWTSQFRQHGITAASSLEAAESNLNWSWVEVKWGLVTHFPFPF